MSLVACPECRKQISSAAAFCPHCGFPNPSQNKGTIATRTSAPPPLPKEDVSDQFPPLLIDAKDAYEAAKLVLQHLNRFRAEGWTTGNAFGGVDGIDKYHIENASQKAVLHFDMRPTLRRGIPDIMLSMLTLLAASPDWTETKINQFKKLNRLTSSPGRSTSELMPSLGPTFKLVVLAFFLLALVTLVVALVAHYSLGTILHAIF